MVKKFKEIFKGFRDFILRGNVVDLAVAIIIGAAFNSVIQSMVKDVITPLIGAIGGQPDFSNVAVTINNSKVMIGNFLNALIAFLINASVVYFVLVLPMNRIMEKIKKGEKVEVSDKICSECLSSIPVKAKRCKFCTAEQKPVEVAKVSNGKKK